MMINEKKEVFNHIQKKEFTLTPQRKVQHSTKFYGYCSECHKKEIREKENS